MAPCRLRRRRKIHAIAIDPSNPKIVYGGSDVAGIYRSRDGGNHFELIGKGLAGFAVADIAINPAAPYQIVALTDDGLYYSINQGDGWIRITGEIRYPSRFWGAGCCSLPETRCGLEPIQGVFNLHEQS